MTAHIRLLGLLIRTGGADMMARAQTTISPAAIATLSEWLDLVEDAPAAVAWLEAGVWNPGSAAWLLQRGLGPDAAADAPPEWLRAWQRGDLDPDAPGRMWAARLS